MTPQETPANKLAEVVAKWPEIHRSYESNWEQGYHDGCVRCANDVQPILAELQRAQGQLTPEIEELLTQIAEGRGPFRRDNYEFAESVIENSKANAKKVLALLSAPTPAAPQEIVNVGDRKFTRIPNIVGSLQEIVADGSAPSQTTTTTPEKTK